MKKTVAVLLIAVCCVLFSACSSEGSKTETTAPTAQPTTSEGTTAAITTQTTTNITTESTTQTPESTAFNEPEAQVQSVEQTEQTVQTSALQMTIGDTPVSVDWEDNESVEALKDLCSNQPLTIQMSMYGGFEQVGSIGADLPQNDMQTTTSSGDIVLYSGDQIVVFYGSNTWAYTRLGHITDKTQSELKELLSNGNITITLGY